LAVERLCQRLVNPQQSIFVDHTSGDCGLIRDDHDQKSILEETKAIYGVGQKLELRGDSQIPNVLDNGSISVEEDGAAR
jgi:hypothetical protein